MRYAEVVDAPDEAPDARLLFPAVTGAATTAVEEILFPASAPSQSDMNISVSIPQSEI